MIGLCTLAILSTNVTTASHPYPPRPRADLEVSVGIIARRLRHPTAIPQWCTHALNKHHAVEKDACKRQFRAKVLGRRVGSDRPKSHYFKVSVLADPYFNFCEIFLCTRRYIRDTVDRVIHRFMSIFQPPKHWPLAIKVIDAKAPPRDRRGRARAPP